LPAEKDGQKMKRGGGVRGRWRNRERREPVKTAHFLPIEQDIVQTKLSFYENRK
jgi:hypothetical protein